MWRSNPGQFLSTLGAITIKLCSHIRSDLSPEVNSTVKREVTESVMEYLFR